jgi:hypothetical protein
MPVFGTLQLADRLVHRPVLRLAGRRAIPRDTTPIALQQSFWDVLALNATSMALCGMMLRQKFAPTIENVWHIPADCVPGTRKDSCVLRRASLYPANLIRDATLAQKSFNCACQIIVHCRPCPRSKRRTISRPALRYLIAIDESSEEVGNNKTGLDFVACKTQQR